MGEPAGDVVGGGAGREGDVADGAVLVESAPEPRPAATDGDPELLARRDELLTPIAHELVRHCKRVLQNEQNELLDALRRQRGRPNPEKLLPPLSQQVTAWSDVLAPAIVEAYVAARTAAEPDDAGSGTRGTWPVWRRRTFAARAGRPGFSAAGRLSSGGP